jgi:hypothetical protein
MYAYQLQTHDVRSRVRIPPGYTTKRCDVLKSTNALLRRRRLSFQISVVRFSLPNARIRVARFFLVEHTKTGKIYQITIKCTKWPQSIHMVVK